MAIDTPTPMVVANVSLSLDGRVSGRGGGYEALPGDLIDDLDSGPLLMQETNAS